MRTTGFALRLGTLLFIKQSVLCYVSDYMAYHELDADGYYVKAGASSLGHTSVLNEVKISRAKLSHITME
jgi:hypothetical protein